MDVAKIKALLETPEYDFMRTNEMIKNHLMYLTMGGSIAYGTNNANSDVDLRGILTETPDTLLGLTTFEQFENHATDTVLYGFKKIIGLMLNCNPNVIEALGTKQEHILFISPEGQMLRDNAGMFLTQKAAHSFGGYATAQLRRLQNALARDSYPQKEKEQHILNTLKIHMHHLQQHYTEFTGESMKLYIDKSEKEDFDEEIFMDVTLTHYPLRDFKNIYSEIGNILAEYGKINHRNRKKDEPHLLKHAMHLIRLFLMGTEILEGKGINTYREHDRDFLLKIRNGVYTYEQIFEMVNEYEKKFMYAEKHSPLPLKPDMKKVQDLVKEINGMVLLKTA